VGITHLGWHALALTPRVSLMEDAVVMEVGASLRLFGGLSRLLQKLLAIHKDHKDAGDAYVLMGAQGQTALAALGRLRTGLPWRESSRLTLGALPLACLGAARPHLAVLERLGCRRWDDLRQLPRDGVARRFGQPLLDAIDQAFGHQPETHAWLELPEVFAQQLELPTLVEHAAALMPGVKRLLTHLRLWLIAHGSGVLGLVLSWQLDPRRDVARRGELTLRLTEATQDMTHVERLLAEHLGQLQLPAPAHTIGLRSLETRPLVSTTLSLLPDERLQGDTLAQLIERLGARLGPAQVQRWQPVARHVPERMQHWLPAQRLPSRPARKAQSLAPELNTRSADELLPSWLLECPLPLSMQGERPCYEGPLTLLVGPQRLETAGWAAHTDSAGGSAAPPEAPVMRDYFVARSDKAGLLWIFRERPSGHQEAPAGWYLHGLFA
jgi:protein ImuB